MLKTWKLQRLTAGAAVFLVGASLGLSGCGTAADGSAKPTLNVGFQAGAPVDLPKFIAEQQGFFQKHDVNVKLQQYADGPTGTQAAVAGQSDIVNTAPSLTISAEQHGACFKYVTRGWAQAYSIIARKGLAQPHANDPWPGPLKDLVGKRVGVIARGSATELALRGFLKLNGVNPDSITYVATGGASTAVAAFKANRVDALMAFPPFRTMLKGHFSTIATLSDYPVAKNYIMGASAVACDALQKKRPEVVNYCKAIWEAVAFINDPQNASAVSKALVKYVAFTPSTAHGVVNELKGTFPNSALTAQVWKDQLPFEPTTIKTMPPFKDSVVSQCVTPSSS